MSQELAHAISACGLSSQVEVKPSVATAYDSNCSLRLDNSQKNPLTLHCEIPDNPLDAILLSDILRLGRNALALERAREEERSRAALWPADPVEDQGDAIFLAEEMQALLTTARRIAATNVPVLITGETGTGKEVLARTIHACSTRANATFLPFNCASTPKDMLDSQLFGHRRGAFTGAAEHFQGVIRAAAGGTLFLDEIGDTSLEVQPKLLRFLEASEVHPIGEAHPARVDVRVIVATNADLDALVRDGRFREDLFYRLSIVRLHLPPLRERRVEIPTLANHYLRKHALEYQKGRPSTVRRHDGVPDALSLAGQRAATRQRDAADRRPRRDQRRTHAGTPVAGNHRLTAALCRHPSASSIRPRSSSAWTNRWPRRSAISSRRWCSGR